MKLWSMREGDSIGAGRRLTAAVLPILACLLLAGCWDEVNLQDVSYISALGVDYEDNKYVIYAQLINFSAIAKTETPQSQEQKFWIGRGEGDSVLLAFYDLSRSGYKALNLEHLKTIVVHQRGLDKIADVLDGLNRQRASRYTSLLYGTNAPIRSLFTTENFFEQSALNSTLYIPKPHENQYTFVDALRMQSVVQLLREPAMTTLLADINTTESYWKHGNESMKTQIISGVHIFKNFRYLGYVEEKDLLGVRWLNESFKKVFMKAGGDENEATVSITKAKFNLKAKTNADKPQFHLKIRLTGHIVELDGELSKREIVASIEERIKGELEAAYTFGVNRGMDLFQLEHNLYRYHHRFWKDHIKHNEWKPDKNQLLIEVDFDLADTGKFGLTSGL